MKASFRSLLQALGKGTTFYGIDISTELPMLQNFPNGSPFAR